MRTPTGANWEITVDGIPRTIVGVTPAGLSIPLWRSTPPDIWVPAPLADAASGSSGTMEPGPTVFAWLRPGATPEAASSELQAIASSGPERPGLPRPSMNGVRWGAMLGP